MGEDKPVHLKNQVSCDMTKTLPYSLGTAFQVFTLASQHLSGQSRFIHHTLCFGASLRVSSALVYFILSYLRVPL